MRKNKSALRRFFYSQRLNILFFKHAVGFQYEFRNFIKKCR